MRHFSPLDYEGSSSGERFDGRSYTIHIAVGWLARRRQRRILELLWPDLSRICACEVELSGSEEVFTVTDDNSTLKIIEFRTPQSWTELVNQASILKESQLSPALWHQMELIPYIGLLLPHRFTDSLAKAQDFLLDLHGSICRINYDVSTQPKE